MKNAFIVAFVFAPSIICASAAFYLAAHGIAGWAWFLAVAAASSLVKIKGA